MEGDKGLVLKDKAAHHAISAKFPKKIDNKGKDLVVQYEVKLQGTFTTKTCQFGTWLTKISIQTVSNAVVPT